ncbi:hypothetical protein T439DRAFT_328535 [Meredithblackwellia eburnea MCA 4105]
MPDRSRSRHPPPFDDPNYSALPASSTAPSVLMQPYGMYQQHQQVYNDPYAPLPGPSGLPQASLTASSVPPDAVPAGQLHHRHAELAHHQPYDPAQAYYEAQPPSQQYSYASFHHPAPSHSRSVAQAFNDSTNPPRTSQGRVPSSTGSAPGWPAPIASSSSSTQYAPHYGSVQPYQQPSLSQDAHMQYHDSASTDREPPSWPSAGFDYARSAPTHPPQPSYIENHPSHQQSRLPHTQTSHVHVSPTFADTNAPPNTTFPYNYFTPSPQYAPQQLTSIPFYSGDVSLHSSRAPSFEANPPESSGLARTRTQSTNSSGGPVNPASEVSSTHPSPVSEGGIHRLLRPISKSLAEERAVSAREAAGTSMPATNKRVAPPRRPGPDGKPPQRKKSSKLSSDVVCACSACGNQFAMATLRGTEEDLDVAFSSLYTCFNCQPIPASSAQDVVSMEDLHALEDFGGVTYSDTLSAQVDRLQGLALNHSGRAPAAARPSHLAGKKRKAQEQEVVTCNVCSRELATGGFVPLDPTQTLKFGVEILCTSCGDRYRRCSDCGGGGGIRAGVGKWRCHEMFPEGRKTCQVSHLRMGALGDMSYSVWPTADIPKGELDHLIKLCRELWISTILATLAIPETLEAIQPIARSFEEVYRLAVDSWSFCEPYFREDVEEEQSLRRYIALRWSVPAPRKKGKAASAKGAHAQPIIDDNGPLIRTGGKQQLAGFVVGEYDYPSGSLFIPFTMPTGSGETFESTTLLFQSLHRRVLNDMMVMNLRRSNDGVARLPIVREAWTMRLYKKETRMLTRRGFLPLEEFIAKYPETDPKDYPPTRPVFLPPELMKGWEVYVKKLEENDDWGHSRVAGKEARGLSM